VQGEPVVPFVWQHLKTFILLTGLCQQQQNFNVLLHFHGNSGYANASQSNVVCALSILLLNVGTPVQLYFRKIHNEICFFILIAKGMNHMLSS
jgi:hypothetical protein